MNLKASATLILCTAFVCLRAQNLSFFPEYPTKDDTIFISYDIENTPFADGTPFTAEAFLFTTPDDHQSQKINFVFKDGVFRAKVTPLDSTAILFLSFKNKEKGLIDNNNGEGYKIIIYSKDQEKKPLRGAYNILAFQFLNPLPALRLKRNPEKVLAYLEKELMLYPELKLNTEFIQVYLFASTRVKDKNSKEVLEEIAERLTSEKRDDEKLAWAYIIYEQIGMPKKANRLKKKIYRKFPNGFLVKNELNDSFYANRSDTREQEEIYAKLVRKIDPSSEEDRQKIKLMAVSLIQTFSQTKQWEKFDKYYESLGEVGPREAPSLNNIAWSIAGGSIEGPTSAAALERAEKLSKATIEAVKKDKDLRKGTPNPSQFNLSMYADTYALICYKLERFEEAIAHQEIALKVFKTLDHYKRYLVYAEKVKTAAEIEDILSNMIMQGIETQEILEKHEALFIANNDIQTAHKKYLEALQMEALKELEQDVLEKLIDKPAPDFVLTNLDGEQVKLSDFEGKVVVLDFWATWCGPCISSFPAMQKAQEKYQAVFLFINTFESGDNKKEAVAQFIDKSNYGFEVLMDLDNDIANSFNVRGIPAKFIIGTDGKIKFESSGFNGDTQKTIKELGMMIKLAEENSY